MLNLTALLLFISPIYAAIESKPAIRIIADAMECDQQSSICIANGNAFAEQPADPDKRTIRAEKFVAHFSKDGKDAKLSQGQAGKNDLKTLEAYGHVVLTNKDSVIRCDKAIYDHATETVELFDNVKITNDQNQLNGSYGHADLKTKKYRVTNKNSQVEGLFINSPKKDK